MSVTWNGQTFYSQAELDRRYPPYPDLGVKVAKLRHGNDRKAHGEAVLDAFRSRQRASLRTVSAPLPKIYEGDNRKIGLTILREVAAQNAAKVHHRDAIPPRMTGDPEMKPNDRFDWSKRCQAVYAAMMAEKRARQTTVIVVAPKRRKR